MTTQPTVIKFFAPVIDITINDGLVKSREMTLFENSRLIITVCYKAIFGKF